MFNSTSKLNLENLHKYLQLTWFILWILLLPPIWLLCFPFRLLAIYLWGRGRGQGHGRIITWNNYVGGVLDEDFIENKYPQGNIVSTMELHGDLSVEKLRLIFEENVLKQRWKSANGGGGGGGGLGEERYPELKQYYESFMGYRFRKTESNFHIADHIREASFPPDLLPSNNNWMKPLTLSMSHLHESLVNGPFPAKFSPWELLLYRNVYLTEEDSHHHQESQLTPKTVIALRMHHSIGDAKSLLKLLVGSLGQKQVKSANAQGQDIGWERRWSFYICFPFYYVWWLMGILRLAFRCHLHPWKTMPNEPGKAVMRFSRKIGMDEVKKVAKTSGVNTSSVIIALIAGAIRRFDERLAEGGITTGYILPKDGHPDYLSNHLYGSAATLPTHLTTASARLSESQSIFTEMRQWEYCVCADLLAYLLGTLPFSTWNPLMMNPVSPMAITNNAGELEGFSIGGVPVTGHRLSVGVMPGSNGLVFCVFSYKDSLRVGLSCKEQSIDEKGVERLMREIGNEMELLKTI